ASDPAIREASHVHVVQHEWLASWRNVAGRRGEWAGMRAGCTRLEYARISLQDRSPHLMFDVWKCAHDDAVPGQDLIDASQLRTRGIDVRGRAVQRWKGVQVVGVEGGQTLFHELNLVGRQLHELSPRMYETVKFAIGPGAAAPSRVSSRGAVRRQA